jgi:hypothetical protein
MTTTTSQFEALVRDCPIEASYGMSGRVRFEPLLRSKSRGQARGMLANLNHRWLGMRSQNVPGNFEKQSNGRRKAPYRSDEIRAPAAVPEALSGVGVRRTN